MCDSLNYTNVNEYIICIFEELEKHSTDVYRTKAYAKAIENLKNYPKLIESEQEALTIPGIGKGLASKIGEILTTGTLSEYENIKRMYPDLDAVTSMFKKIYSVGPKTAMQWYRAGYKKYSDIPAAELTEVRRVSIQYLHETEQRIPREDIAYFETELRNYLQRIGANIEFKICGSYARGTPTSGDIDILVNSQQYDPESIMRVILSFPMFTHKFSLGTKKFNGLVEIRGIHRRVDIEITPSHEYGPALAYFTGPVEFNVLMRQRAIQLGYRLNEKALLDSAGAPIYVRDEKHLFELLGVTYLTPEQRQAYVIKK
jgi:DNA polymerase/3'-5' exonuclease PolX